ncbi:MAG: sodium:proton symporter [Devosiaceae bacterium]|nr:sodium:proton symporter [Devosiaceae bacterium MH13]
MNALALPIHWLAFIGRHGTVAVAVSLIIGTCLLFLSASFRPWLNEAVLLLLTLAFLRIGFRALGSELKRPWAVLAAVGFAMLVVPALVFQGARLLDLQQSQPDFYLALFIALAVPPVAAVPIFASLLRLPGAVALTFLILCIIATPFAATAHALVFFEPDALPFDGVAIGLRLAGFLAAAALLAFLIEKIATVERLDRHRAPLDGLNVLGMFVFAVAVMDGVGPALLQTPALVLGLLAATFALAIGQIALMRVLLWFMEGSRALAVAMATGLRNMGLMVASLGVALPETTWLWFAIGQFPIFFMPWMLELFRRKSAGSAAAHSTSSTP